MFRQLNTAEDLENILQWMEDNLNAVQRDDPSTAGQDYLLPTGAIVDAALGTLTVSDDLDWDALRINARGALWVQDETGLADDSAFSIGSNLVGAVGFLADDTTPDSVDEGDIGIPRMTLTRKPYAVITDPTSENNMAVDGSGHAQIDIAADSAGLATEATLSTINGKLVDGTDIGDVTVNNASSAPVPTADTITTLVGNAQGTLSVSDTGADTSGLTAGIYDLWTDVDVHIKVHASDASDVTTSTGYLLYNRNTITVYIPGTNVLGGICASGESGTLSYHKVD